MMKEMKVVMLHPNCPNYGLVKDVGQIPYLLNKENGIHAALASSEIDLNGQYLDYLYQMSFYQLPSSNCFLSGLSFILKNAKNVDWFFFFFGGRRCYYWIKLYKFLNPSGKVYIKMDLSYEGCRRFATSKKERKIFLKSSKAADLVSVESIKIKNLVKEYTGYDPIYIPNGYIEVEDKCLSLIEKKNIFLTVARVGDESKASDILLESFAQSAKDHNWVLKIVGPVKKEFEKFIKEYFIRYPLIKDRVIFTGPVWNKDDLYREYRAAKVFVLPSRWEGSPLVVPEALANGCRVILSDVIPSAKEFTNNYKFGCKIKHNSIDSLKLALINESKRKFDKNECNEIIEYAKVNFSWTCIVQRLLNYMRFDN